MKNNIAAKHDIGVRLSYCFKIRVGKQKPLVATELVPCAHYGNFRDVASDVVQLRITRCQIAIEFPSRAPDFKQRAGAVARTEHLPEHLDLVTPLKPVLQHEYRYATPRIEEPSVIPPHPCIEVAHGCRMLSGSREAS